MDHVLCSSGCRSPSHKKHKKEKKEKHKKHKKEKKKHKKEKRSRHDSESEGEEANGIADKVDAGEDVPAASPVAGDTQS
jgi:hypothetical protein